MSSCELDSNGHCITCSDEALPASVLRVDGENGLALVTIEGSETEEEIDITLVDDIVPGDTVLVH
ncbi:MAG: HypC/HybG/HupF family hydrogenase formation chaperone, partial [Ktedonobacteraceae bacterium]